jgi:hypothetical protein
MITAAAFALALLQTPSKSDPLLDDLEHRAVNFFWEQSSPQTGFSKDRATNSGESDDHDVASCASVGFALAAYTIGAERNWIPRNEARERTRTTLAHLLSDWPHKNGWLYHFISYKTGERIWNCEASTIDTSICLAGILVAEQYWKDADVTRDSDAFIKRMDWNYMINDGGKTKDGDTVCMGWRPEQGFLDARWNNWDELKMIYVQGYGATDMPTTGWDKIVRPLIRYKGWNILAGGPLFMHEMSESFYNFKGLRDPIGYNYWVESKNAALGNRQYCIDNPKDFKGYGSDFWGLSACDTPSGYGAKGAPGWIEDDGTITPTSAVAAIQFVPNEALSFAKAMRRDHPEAWGKYGFPNGYNPSKNWVGPDVIGIDLGMMMCAVENYRTGMVSKLSASHPIVKRGFERMGLKPAKDDVLLITSS